VPELWEVKGAAKIRLFGPKDALDRVQTPAGVEQGRVAPDELLWLGDPEQASELEAEGRRQLAGVGERGLVVDNSDGWALFSIVGDGRADALARLSSLRLPDEGFRQGKVAGVPGKVFARSGRIDVLCTSDVRWYVRERLLHAGADVGLSEGRVPESGAVSKAVESGAR
jgi:sarcosine oxidase gamma subunit